MMTHVHSSNIRQYEAVLDGMFRDRKRVFVDLLKWDVPVVGDHERDQFDDEYAEYVIICDPITGAHEGSMRLLRTDRPHILGDLFPMLCEEGAPRGPQYRELTRLCLSPRLKARHRLRVRNRLFTSLVEYGLMTGIIGYTGVAEMGWYQQLLALGWRCTPLGLPQKIGQDTLAALLAHVEVDTINLLRAAGTYDSGPIDLAQAA
ncbi:MAG TPA: acyl-homoserine-lactone synthase [Sphingobium sp.]